MATPFSNKCKILGEFWIRFKQDETYKEFIEYNDIGLPLAYFVSSELVELTDAGNRWINETWEVLSQAMQLDDTEFESLDEVIDWWNENNPD